MMLAAVVILSQLISGLQGVPGSAREDAIAQVSELPNPTVHALLNSANWRGRDAAVKGLETADPPRLGLLMEIARGHAKVTTRRSAIRAVGRAGEAGYCDTLRTLLGDGSVSVILDVMAERKDCDDRIVDPYVTDSDADVRRRAFQLLVSTNKARALSISAEALGDSHYGVRQVVSGFLVQIAEDALPVLDGALRDTSRLRRSTALLTLGEMGDAGQALLADALSGSAWYDRLIAADGLGRIGGRQAVDRIESQLQVESHPLVLMSLQRARAQALRTDHE